MLKSRKKSGYKFVDRRVTNCIGAYIIMDTLIKAKLQEFIEEHFPDTKKGNPIYKPKDAYMAYFMNMLTGKKRIEQFVGNRINFIHKEEGKSGSKYFKSNISPDTIRRWVCAQSEGYNIVRYTSQKKTSAYKIFRATKLNIKIMEAIDYFKIYDKSEVLCLDIDTTTLDTHNRDAKTHYKQHVGYNPLIASLDNGSTMTPCYLEGRTGNVNPFVKIDEAVMIIVKKFRAMGYTIRSVRIDAAGYKMSSLAQYNEMGLKFFVRAKLSANDTFNVNRTKVKLKGKIVEIDSKIKRVGDNLYNYVYNWANTTDKQYSIVTNDIEMKQSDVIQMFRNRANLEKIIRELKDFGWRTMLSHDLEHCTTYLGMSVLCFIKYKYLLKTYSSILNNVFIQPNITMQTFRSKFIDCIGEVDTKGNFSILDSSKQKMLIPILNYNNN